MTRVVALFSALMFTAGLGEPPTAWAQTKDAAQSQAPAKTEKKTATKKGRVDINKASLAELQGLPGVGEADAKKIIENRPYSGRFDLVTKNVLPQATYDKIRGQITTTAEAAGKKSKLDLNSASLNELKALPGVDEATAKKIIENRPYGKKEELVQKKILTQTALDTIRNEVGTQSATPLDPKAAAEKAAKKEARLDLNSATLEELRAIPGLGAVHAKKIVANRPYVKRRELVERNIIPQATYDKIKDHISAQTN